MPIDINIDFLVRFIDEGWDFFYQMSIAILRVLEPWLLHQTEIDTILWILKFRDLNPKKLTSLMSQNSPESPKSLAPSNLSSFVEIDRPTSNKIKIVNAIKAPNDQEVAEDNINPEGDENSLEFEKVESTQN